MESKNLTLLEDFIAHCNGHPEERFWQALRNWSGADRINWCKSNPESSDIGSIPEHDTFYWENKNN